MVMILEVTKIAVERVPGNEKVESCGIGAF